LRKIFAIITISILCLSGTLVIANYVDELDQYQTEMTENIFLLVGQFTIFENPLYLQTAQSFIPTKDILTRVELYIGKNSTTTYPYVLSIKDNLTHEDLTTISLDPEDIPTGDFGWVEFDFDDISVVTGQTYYIVSYTENITDNWYAIAANNISESYPYGCVWISLDDGDSWSNESYESMFIETNNNQVGQKRFEDMYTWDLCFKTYGRENNAPGNVNILGPVKGKPNTKYDYVLNATDPNGDNIRFFVDFGDGDTIWTDYTTSGTSVIVSHSWAKKGNYIIKVLAQDEYGAEGPESTLDMAIPKNKPIDKPIFKILSNQPYIFMILMHILLKFGL